MKLSTTRFGYHSLYIFRSKNWILSVILILLIILQATPANAASTKIEFKDIVSIMISVLALIISIVATINTEKKANTEKERTIRSQLTDVLSRIIALNLENAKLFKETASSDPAYYQNVSSILNQENSFLLHQAVYLTGQIPNLVSAFELNTIAVAHANAWDMLIAEQYHKKAIQFCHNDFNKSLATRSYANFLFTQRRFEEGREQFRQAIILLKGGDNLVRYTNGLTYQMWAISEMIYALSPHLAEDYFLNAKNEFSGIDNEYTKSNALKGLDAAQKQTASPPHLLHNPI